MSDKIAVSKLHLDLHNPRLPENLVDVDPETVLSYYYENETIDELVTSMLKNGYFEHEPLIVRDNGESYVVLEGNRRLTALLIINNDALARKLPRPDPPPTISQLNNLQEIPCVVVGNRNEVRVLLGFRHIGGQRKWKPESKARFIVDEVQKIKADSENPFLDVARGIGSNSQGVRNYYIAMRLLFRARDEFGLDVSYVQHKRFGVWLRCMNSGDIKSFIGLNSPTSYLEVEIQLREVREKQLEQVLKDLSPSNGGTPVLADSRYVTLYGRVLLNETAVAALRNYRNLQVAGQIVLRESLPDRIINLARMCAVFLDEVTEAEPTDELWHAVRKLQRNTRQLYAVAKSARELEADD